jgi:hypothetical protein
MAIKNTPKDKIHLNSFLGGSSIDFKYGIANSFFSSQALDFRQKASQMSVLPGAREASHTLKDLITAMVQDPNGVRYGVGDQGYLYKVNTSGVISNFGQLNSNGAAGIAYNQQSDQLYIPSQQTVSLYGQVQGTPQLRKDNFGPSASVANGSVNIYNSATNAYDTPRNNAASVAGGITPSNYATQVTNTLANTYVIPSAINESITNFCPFIPDIEPFYSIAVYITTVGTGNWTLTLHDSLNNTLSSVTITHANALAGWNNFVFSSQVRAIPNAFATGNAAGYHFHLTSSSASDTAAVATINANDLTGCNMLLFAYRLVQTNNGWHPTTIFGQILCIGNGPYLSTYNFGNDSSPNNVQWNRHTLSLDWGYEVCGLTVNNQYLVIAAEKRSNTTSKSYQDGYLYFWDGSNINWNFKIEIPMGAPYSVYTLNNITYFYCAGSLFAWGGGQQVIKVRYIAYQNTDYLGTVDSTIVNPNMMDVRYNLLMLGYPSSTTNVNTNYGIYSWGCVELTYPNSFGYSYALSNGYQNYSASNNLKIGCIKNFVDTMYLSWQYTDSGSVTHYGLDIIDNNSTPAPNFNWQSLIYDGGVRYKLKKGLRYKINFLPLPSGCTLTANYMIDRGTPISADPDTSTAYSAVVGETSIVIELNNARYHELQWGFSGTCSSLATSPPTITGITMESDGLEDETSVRKDG